MDRFDLDTAIAEVVIFSGILVFLLIGYLGTLQLMPIAPPSGFNTVTWPLVRYICPIGMISCILAEDLITGLQIAISLYHDK